MVSIAGLAGSILLPVAWLFETYRTYETQDIEAVDERFVALYVLGSLLLAYHAFQLRDLPFILLNVTMVLFTSTELAMLLKIKRRD